jgi:hypothetical protein
MSTFVAVAYFVLKLVDIKYVKKENLVLKLVFRDTIIVYLSSLIGLYLVDNIDSSTVENNVSVYTDKPDF